MWDHLGSEDHSVLIFPARFKTATVRRLLFPPQDAHFKLCKNVLDFCKLSVEATGVKQTRVCNDTFS